MIMMMMMMMIMMMDDDNDDYEHFPASISCTSSWMLQSPPTRQEELEYRIQ